MAGNLSVEAQERYRLIRHRLVAEVPPPARVVELGAAPGDQIAMLAELGYDAVAVDLGVASDEWSDGSPNRMAEMLQQAGVKLVLWDLERTPYPLPDASFDAVVMTEVFEHLRDYPAHSLLEVRRILRPGGRLYFTTPNAAYVVNRLRLLRGGSVYSPLPDWIGGLPHARHAREYTLAEIRQLFAHAGLVVRVATSRHFNQRSGRSGPVMVAAKRAVDTVARLRPSLGPVIVVVGERPRE